MQCIDRSSNLWATATNNCFSNYKNFAALSAFERVIELQGTNICCFCPNNYACFIMFDEYFWWITGTMNPNILHLNLYRNAEEQSYNEEIYFFVKNLLLLFMISQFNECQDQLLNKIGKGLINLRLCFRNIFRYRKLMRKW